MLSGAGFKIVYLDAGLQTLDYKKALSPELFVLLGGPIGAYEETLYPFLKEELLYLEKRLQADLPTLGICLGAQLMARALGARVYPGPQKEIGWAPLALTEEGMSTSIRYLAPSKTRMFHWHGDTFELPEGARLLASTNLYKHQIFSKGRSSLAIQCHPEADFRRLEQWFIGHASELHTSGVSVSSLRQETLEFGPALKSQGTEFLRDWLDCQGLL